VDALLLRLRNRVRELPACMGVPSVQDAAEATDRHVAYASCEGPDAMIRVDVQDEDGVGTKKPTVRVYEDDKLVCEVVASIELKPGADGGLYRCVVFSRNESP
jgi:hypothetical protein